MPDTQEPQTPVQAQGAAPAAAPAQTTPNPAASDLGSPPKEVAAATPGATAPAASDKVAAPEAFEVSFPEGEEVDTAFADKFKETCRANGMTAKQAQAMVDLQFNRVKETRAAYEQHLAQNREILKKDPEFGGAKYEENMEVAKKGLVKFGSPELVKELTTMGLQTNPNVVKHFYKLGLADSEGVTPRAPAPSSQPNPAAEEEARLKARYPNTKY